MAKVSIVIPVYNVERYLRECLESVQKQTLKDIEIICVDDGSTDSSSSILDEYAQKDERFVIIHKQNEGYGKTINVGIKAATAHYIGIVESDDMVLPDMYERLLEFMDRHPVDVMKADFYEFYEVENGTYIEQYIPLISDEKLERLYETEFNIRENEEAFLFNKHTWTGLYNRKFLEHENIRHHETPGASYQDVGFWFQTMAKSKSIYFVKQAFYRYRIDNPNSSMYSNSKVFEVCEEYNFIHDMLNQMGEDGKPFHKWVAYMKITECLNSMYRISDKYRESLAQRIKEEFLKELKQDYVRPQLYPDYWKIRIFKVITSPISYVQEENLRRKKIEDALKGYDTVILYGAGKIGVKTQQLLKEGRLNTKIKYFAVTDITDNPDIVMGIPVREIDSLKDYKERALIIITVGRNYEDEVEDILKQKEFRHYIRVNDMQ